MNIRKQYPELSAAIVNMKSGTAFRGIIYKVSGRFTILRNSELLADRGAKVQPRSLDGEIILNSSDIDFIQAVK